ncbi:LutC/YkgG family protein [Olivibacter domesticus]|uniref:L-lactate dehydrogenase complex protein LldG n=1 Tax=Olivibacter domesticus TaxID=407022 RepID=A0A1H7TCN7_OLID1|nr:LUD domain-containing protein [Olivibacter domesticus]SEL82561.1 L-lactate dehydrogenase complex protein LldG [Olivibacter domesticus]
MNSREKILQAVKLAQPEVLPLPTALETPTVYSDPVVKFTEVAQAVGSSVIEVNSLEAIEDHLKEVYLPELQKKWQASGKLRVVSTSVGFENFAEQIDSSDIDPHTFQDVEVAIMKADLGVAENSALWVPETIIRVLPFICQHLILLVDKKTIVSNMHQAYERMGLGQDDYGAFIAGPSKTADIEQSLVLGAHGPRSLWIYLIGDVE